MWALQVTSAHFVSDFAATPWADCCRSHSTHCRWQRTPAGWAATNPPAFWKLLHLEPAPCTPPRTWCTAWAPGWAASGSATPWRPRSATGSRPDQWPTGCSGRCCYGSGRNSAAEQSWPGFWSKCSASSDRSTGGPTCNRPPSGCYSDPWPCCPAGSRRSTPGFARPRSPGTQQQNTWARHWPRHWDTEPSGRRRWDRSRRTGRRSSTEQSRGSKKLVNRIYRNLLEWPTWLSQRNSEPGQLSFTCSNWAAKSSRVMFFNASSSVFGFPTDDDVDFFWVDDAPAFFTGFFLTGDLLVLDEDEALELDFAGEWDLLLLLLLEPNRLRYRWVGTVDKKRENL